MAKASSRSKSKISTRVLFGRNVRTLRRLREMSQEELADRAGVYRSHITLIERGEINFTVDTMETIAQAMDLEVRDLLDPALELEHLRGAKEK
ncbi:MAG: helix-turn-helix domain-containing protein [Burkholderiaceae bacterium]